MPTSCLILWKAIFIESDHYTNYNPSIYDTDEIVIKSCRVCVILSLEYSDTRIRIVFTFPYFFFLYHNRLILIFKCLFIEPFVYLQFILYQVASALSIQLRFLNSFKYLLQTITRCSLFLFVSVHSCAISSSYYGKKKKLTYMYLENWRLDEKRHQTKRMRKRKREKRMVRAQSVQHK